MLKFLFAFWIVFAGCNSQTNDRENRTDTSDSPIPQRDAIREVESAEETINLGSAKVASSERVAVFGESAVQQRDTVSLADFGARGSGADETKIIQEALESAIGKTLYIPKPIKHYLTGQLIIPSNLTIICDPEVVFLAKNTLRQDYKDFEVLFRFEDSENVVFDGQGAVFKMNKSHFRKEFNHLFMINGAKNVTIRNVTASDSGGDGFYIGAIRSKNKFPVNIVIENCTAINNRRQGLSITSGKDVLVTNSSFDKSEGTDPAAGLDIEPGNASAILQNIRVKDCTANNNRKRGFVVILNRMNNNSSPVDIVFENCVSVGNLEGFSSRQFYGVQGKVEFINCVARNSRLTGFTESSCLANSVKKIYRNCVVDNSNTSGLKMDHHLYKADYYLSGTAKNRQTIGNSQFINCVSTTKQGRRAIDYGFVVDNGNGEIQNVVVENFKTEGLPEEYKIFVPSHQSKALSVK